MAQRIATVAVIKDIAVLEELSTTYRANKVVLRRDWESGLKKLETQNYEVHKRLQKFTLAQIKWIWSKYQNVASGYCAIADCKNKVSGEDIYCKEHHTKPMYYRGIYSMPSILDHREAAKKAIQAMDEKQLKKLVIKNIDKMHLNGRRNILRETSYPDLVKE